MKVDSVSEEWHDSRNLENEGDGEVKWLVGQRPIGDQEDTETSKEKVEGFLFEFECEKQEEYETGHKKKESLSHRM